MEGIQNTPGFFGTGANLLTDFNLAIQILFYITLCLGVVAQLRRQGPWHNRFQTPVVWLNLLFIVFVMLPSFIMIAPQLPHNFTQTVYLVPIMHAVLGLLAEGVAIYCFLAGVKILPRQIGLLRYWMWLAFVLWTLTILFGLSIYLVWYTGSVS